MSALSARWRLAFEKGKASRLLAELDDLLADTFPEDRDQVARQFIAEKNVKLIYHMLGIYRTRVRPEAWMDWEGAEGAAAEGLCRAAREWSPEYRSRTTGGPVRFSSYACRAMWCSLDRWREVEVRRGVISPRPGVAVFAWGDGMFYVPGGSEPTADDCPIAAYGKRLTGREKSVLSLLYGFDGRGAKRLKDVGALLNISPERVRQIKDEAVGKMRAEAEGSLCPVN